MGYRRGMGTFSGADAAPEAERIRWPWALLGFVLLEVALIGAAFGWVAIYSYLIEPGRDRAAYEAYAQVASPIVSIVAGVPVFWGAGRILRGRLQRDASRTALLLGGVYLAVDGLMVLTMAGGQRYILAVAAVGYLTKIGALYLGVRGLPPAARGG